MGVESCLLDKGWTKKQVTEFVGEEIITEADYIQAVRGIMKKESDAIKNMKLQAVAIDSAVTSINAHPDGAGRGLLSLLAFDKTGKSKTLNIDTLSDAYSRIGFKDMAEMMEELMPKAKQGFKTDEKLRADIIKEIFGRATNNPKAAKFAKAFADANEKMLKIHKQFGGNIEADPQWHLPQNHNNMRIRAVDRDTWVNDLLDGDQLDYRNMWDAKTDPDNPKRFASKEDLRPALENMYDAITTNGATKMDWEKAGYKDLATSGLTNRKRFLRFKDGESWIAYQHKYGDPDIYSSMITHMQSMGREIAMMQMLGPNPGAAFNFLSAMAEVSASKNKTGTRLIGRAKNTWKDLSGQVTGENNRIQAWSERIRSVMSFKLGSASISAIGDQGTLALTARTHGIPAVKNMHKFIKNLADGEEKQFLLQTGINVDYVIDVTSGAARFSDTEKTGKAGKFVDRYLRWSGLNAMTEAGRASIQLSTLGHLANVDKKTWAELSTKNRAMLEQFGFTEADWKIMAKSKKQNIKGAKYLDNRVLPKHMQLKVSNMMDVLAYHAVPAPDAEVRAILRQGLEGGTIPGELIRGIGQFKSFGVSVLLYHVNAGINAGSPMSRTKYLGSLLAYTTVMGGLAVQLKQLSAGKEPLDINDPRFALKAIMQGGGFGIFGDFLFRDYTSYGSSFWGTLAGPALSSFETLVRDVILANSQKAIKDAVDGNFEILEFLSEVGTSSVEELRKTLPTQLWYTKLIADRAMYEQINQLIDSRYAEKLNRRESKQIQDTGAANWFPTIEQ